MRVNKCLPSWLTNVYYQWVNKHGGYVNTPCLPRVFTLMFMDGQSFRLERIYCRIIDSLASGASRATSESIGLLDRLIKER
jgi:hypothetical protein